MNDDNWRDALRLQVEDAVDKAVTKGARQEEVFAALLADVDRLRKLHEKDPDPADHPAEATAVEEPANDWPGADQR